MPKVDDLRWLKEHRVPELLNELATTMLAVKPSEITSFIAEWALKKEKQQRAQQAHTPPAAPGMPHRESIISLSRTTSAANGFDMNSYNVISTGAIPPAHFSGVPYAAENVIPMNPYGANDVTNECSADTYTNAQPPLQRQDSARRTSRPNASGTDTPLTEGAWPAARPTNMDLATRHTNPEGQFDFVQCIGEGHYGKVYEAVRRADGQTVAVKKVTIEGDWVEQEVQHLLHCRSDWVVSLLSSHYHPDEDNLWIVMEMLSLSLATLAEMVGPKAFSESMIAVIAREILAGLATLHSFMRVHLDVKPGNMLFNHERTRIKIADFGTMQVIGEDCIQLGDFAFMSPEVAYSQGKYNGGSDIWSFAITMLYLSDGEAPMWREKPELLMFMHKDTCLVCRPPVPHTLLPQQQITPPPICSVRRCGNRSCGPTPTRSFSTSVSTRIRPTVRRHKSCSTPPG